MYPSDITIASTVPTTYSIVTERASSSLYSDPSQPLAEPKVLTISHETDKSGRVSSVVYIDDIASLVNTTVGAPAVVDTVKCQFKLMYNPTLGRATLEADLAQLREELTVFVSDSTNWTKLLNKEH
jgi:hypothetical protein